jgi:hypothetical protein
VYYSAFEIDVFPSSVQNFSQARSGQDEQSNRRDGEWVGNCSPPLRLGRVFCFGLGFVHGPRQTYRLCNSEHIAKSRKFVGCQISLAAVFWVPLNAFRRIVAKLHFVTSRGPGPNAGYQGKATIRRERTIRKRRVQPRNVPPPNVDDSPRTKGRENVNIQEQPVFVTSAVFALKCDVLLHELVRDFSESPNVACGPALLYRVGPGLDCAEELFSL